MTVRVNVAPGLLNWAVERAGWDQETIERREPKLMNWISGECLPTLKQLENFAKATHTPFGMLFLEEPPDEKIPIPDMRTMGNSKVTRPSADLLDTIYLCQDRQDWYRAYAQDNDLDKPAFVGSATINSTPKDIAYKISAQLGLTSVEDGNFVSSDRSMRELIDRVEQTGVLVMVNGVVGANTRRKLNPEEFRGFALSDEFAPLIFVNGSDTKTAQTFTLIHELAHIWLGSSALSDASVTANHGKEEELWCNNVAAEVLVPLETFSKEDLSSIGVKELEVLAKKYGVSTFVILRRMYDAKFLTWKDFRDQYETEQIRIANIMESNPPRTNGGNYYYTQPVRLSKQFTQAVIASTFEGTTTYRDAYQLLGTKKHSTFVSLANHLGVA